MGKSTLSTFLTKFQGQTKLAIAIFIVTICFYYFYVANVDDAPTEEQSLLMSTVQVSPYGKADIAGKNKGEDFLEVKVIPVDLADESLNLLPKDSFSHACVIDAGSSGSRVHIYRYGRLRSSMGALYVLPNHDSFKEKPGLSSFAANPKDAATSMVKLVEFMKSKIPEFQWSHTPVWLKATAGMRMLSPDQQVAIIQSVQQFLIDKSNSPFLFRAEWAAIIPGTNEGGFGWIAYNYLRKMIGPKRPLDDTEITTYAVVEMGGASAQVTAMAKPDEVKLIPDENLFSFDIAGQHYALYTHSYLGYGGEQAREKLSKNLEISGDIIKDPCLNVGYMRSRDVSRRDVFDGSSEVGVAVEGDSDEKSCLKAVKSSIIDSVNMESCVHMIGGQYTMDCQSQPKWVSSIENYLVFENFFWAASGAHVLNDGHKSSDIDAPPSFPLITTPKEYKDASAEVCSKKWTQVNEEYPKDGQEKSNNNKWCFMLSYATSFLIDGLKLPLTKEITVQRNVDGSEIEWALGAVYKELEDFLSTNRKIESISFAREFTAGSVNEDYSKNKFASFKRLRSETSGFEHH